MSQNRKNSSRNTNRKRKHKILTKRQIKKAKQYAVMLCLLLVIVLILYLVISGIVSLFHDDEAKKTSGKVASNLDVKGRMVDRPEIDVNLLTVSSYSRPGIELDEVNGIVVHYVGNPGTTAYQNRNYFENLKTTKKTKASSHFIVGLEGEIVQCIPTAEMAYCSNERNDDTIAIEVCHPKENGKFTEETYESLVHLTAFLCCKYDLDTDSLLRHYDITGKLCPKYYVEHEGKWIQFKEDVASFIKENSYEE